VNTESPGAQTSYIESQVGNRNVCLCFVRSDCELAFSPTVSAGGSFHDSRRSVSEVDECDSGNGIVVGRGESEDRKEE
jgi:hypothetical protein